MAVEKLSEYFNSSESKQSLQRIFVAYQIERAIEKEWSEKVGVAVADLIITIKCKSTAQASVFNLRKQKVYALISRFAHGKRYQIRIKITGR